MSWAVVSLALVAAVAIVSAVARTVALAAIDAQMAWAKARDVDALRAELDELRERVRRAEVSATEAAQTAGMLGATRRR